MFYTYCTRNGSENILHVWESPIVPGQMMTEAYTVADLERICLEAKVDAVDFCCGWGLPSRPVDTTKCAKWFRKLVRQTERREAERIQRDGLY
jgi:hypothetical protein